MSTLSQPSLFSWQIVDRSPEIVRLARMLDALADGPLLDALCARRPGRPREYSPIALWRCVVAFAFLGHRTIADFIRELARNGELRQVRGLEPIEGEAAVPPDYQFSRFFDRLSEFHDLVQEVFEKLLDSLKFRCPAAAYGIECENRDACRCRPGVRDGRHGRVVRVALERDPRVLMPIHFHSRNFERAYKKRTAVERFFSRVDNVHGFEHAIVKSRARMQTRLALTLIATLATARSWIEAHKPDRMRSMRQAA